MSKRQYPSYEYSTTGEAIEFYVDWLEFKIEWEHEFEEGMPKYMEVVKDKLTLHLSEHHGDATPGSKVFLWCTGLKEYHKMLIGKQYKNNWPAWKKFMIRGHSMS